MISEHDFARLAFKERLTELLFELLDGATQCGLGEIQLLSRTGEVLRAGQGHELFEQVEIQFVPHLCM
jgi:hypothetical protein